MLLTTTDNRLRRSAIVGIGQELRGDDAAGLIVARKLHRLASANLLVIEAGAAPENFTGVLRRFAPDRILLVDAAHMGEPLGTIRLFSLDDTLLSSSTTHALSSHLWAAFLTADLNCAVKLLGIQVAQDRLGADLTLPVERSVRRIIRYFGSVSHSH